MSTTAARNRIAGAVLLLAANALVFASTGFAQGSAPETTLQSTVWRWVHSVLNDDTLVTPIDRDRYTVAFGADERSLSIGAVATTHLVCDEAIMDQEQAYLAALQASRQYELAADRLTLRNNNGAIQVDSLPANPSK